MLLGDVRISTNVPNRAANGERALGTRVSASVRTQVLDAGKKWIDRSYVESDWYISGYEPVVDVNGERIGMLHAGFAEAPYSATLHQALLALTVLLMLGALIGVVLAIRGARSIFQPVEAMSAVVHAEQAGQRRRVGPVASRDELGELAMQFDTMLDLLESRNAEIRKAADELEDKVEQRTRELRDKNARLEKTIELLQETRKQLVVAEKLAAVGELTAGVAHEVNNPTAVILGNMDILIDQLKGQLAPVQTEVDLIIEQVYRIRTIVDKLLQFSRSGQQGGGVGRLNVNDVIEDTLALVRHELDIHNIRINPRYGAIEEIGINRQELQQVLVNLIINALHASPESGRVDLVTRIWPGKGVVICVKDHGEGIPPDVLDRVFDPFFTTRRGGTGLGLSVSYGLVRRYGGYITVDSKLGKGTRFEVFLRSEPLPMEHEDALLAI
ncbi:MAG: cache domain-containing protein [Pseudomonadota bacterium]|nr:MAG: cache domain-containing protein [Pseudomonadota bacterium]